MIVLVCGSVQWADFGTILRRMAKLPPDTVIVHGGARGADRLAGIAARTLHFKEVVEDADWRPTPETPKWRIRRRRNGEPYDFAAGFARNIRMLEEHEIGLVLAFQRDGSGGTQHCIDEARKRGIPVEVEERRSQAA